MNILSDIPRFYIEHLNPKLTSHDAGEDFQRFVHELLLFDFPDLQFFPSRGKDGGVDLLQETPSSYQIFECKYITRDGWEEARTRWRSVASKLASNLAGSEGPQSGQSQYNIWYRTGPAIQSYFFCVSSIISPPEQFVALQQEIAQFFSSLGTTYNHLAHLTNLEVKILDWDSLCNRLRKHPHLIYKWFPLTRPQGLIPLEEAPDRGTFRSYLSSEQLPYYGRSHHLQVVPAPPGINIPDEHNLLSQIRDGNETGLIITGSGGVGKTRLTLEIGRLAQSLGWTVLRVQSRWRGNAIEEVAERFTPENLVLLLVDYVETQRDFQELVETLNSINDNYFLRLRYVANCRTSYYPAIVATSRHFRVDLSPIKYDLAQPWVESYQQQTVHHILEQSGIKVTDKHLAVCRNIPVLAVFVSYLHQTNRESDLAELLEEADFSAWVAKRMELSLGDINFSIARYLALFMSLFPITEDAALRLDSATYGLLLDKLAVDGWIEKLPPDQSHDVSTWVTAHDVLADQILLTYLDRIRPTINRFIHEIFEVAYGVGALRSVLITLQRLADQPLLKSLDWLEQLGRELQQEPAHWREARNILIRTPLLLPQQRIELLGHHSEVWRGAEEETDFQNPLGWLARWAAEQEENKEPQLSPEQRAYLVSWIEKAAGWATQSNYILTGGIRFCPEAVRDVALNWILNRPEEFQTHYLMVAWLEQGLPLEDISSAVQKWAARFARVSNFSFLIKAWLQAEGDKEAFKDYMLTWLETYQAHEGARFVYSAWLRARGDTETIKGHILAWLETYQGHEGATFVYSAWLEAGGDTEAIKQHMLAWLDIYHAHEDARFIYSIWLEAGGDTETIKDYMLIWLGIYQSHASASFVYRTWLGAGGDIEAIKQHMLTWLETYQLNESAGFVYSAWLEAGGDTEAIKQHMLAWLDIYQGHENVQFVYRSWLRVGGDTETIKDYMLTWLETYQAHEGARFIYSIWLEAGGDTEAIKQHMLAWLDIYHAHEDATFVYSAWLEAGGDTEAIKQHMLAWLDIYQGHENVQFVYWSWLRAGGDIEAIKQHMLTWLETYQLNESAGFVYSAWLDAEGELRLIRPYLIRWLEINNNAVGADFVIRSWLEAGGELDDVKQFLLLWLKTHGGDANADFLFNAWLQRGGEFTLVRDAAILWLNNNYEKAEAVYLTKYLARQHDIPVETVRNILRWCLLFSNDIDALWRLTQLGRHLKDERVADDVIKASSAVVGHLLKRRYLLPKLTSSQIIALFSYLIESPALQSSHLRCRVDALLVRWIRNPSFVESEPSNIYIQRISHLQRLKELLSSGALDISRDRKPLEWFLRWVNNWETFNKLKAVPLLTALKQEFPAPGLWDIVKFE